MINFDTRTTGVVESFASNDPPIIDRGGKQDAITADYQSALSDLRKHFADLSNPYVVKRITGIFRSITVVDGLKGLLAKFPKELLPVSTYSIIQRFDTYILSACKSTNSQDLHTIRKIIKSDIEALADIRPKHVTLPQELDQLLSLDATHTWENEIIDQISGQRTHVSLSSLKNTISLAEQTKIEVELQKKNLPSLNILLSNIFTRALRQKSMTRVCDDGAEGRRRDQLKRHLDTKFDKLCELLTSQPVLLEQVTINLVNNRLLTVEENALNLPDELTNILATLLQMHQGFSQESLATSDILRRATLRAIQERIALVPDNSVSIEKAMELLHLAYVRVEKMKGPIALFLGPTNSGKSSAIAFCQGAIFDGNTNEVGDQIYVLTDRNQNNTMYPKISQRIGISETLYATPWNVRIDDRTNATFVDAAGEYDTRGGAYELCANFSLDLAVLSEACEVGALVITVPCNALVEDNGSSFLRLMKLIKGRFPACFDRDAPQRHNVYLLITKWANASAAILKPLLTGERAKGYVDQIKIELNRQEQQHKAEIGHDTHESMRENRNFWGFFQRLGEDEQVCLFDPEDNPQKRTALIKAISDRMLRRPGLKASYVPMMKNPEMQTQFGNIITPSAEMGVKLLEGYCVTVVEDIQEADGQIQDAQKRLQELQQQRQRRAEEILLFTQEIEAVTRLIQELENTLENTENIPVHLQPDLPATQTIANIRKRLAELEKQQKRIGPRIAMWAGIPIVIGGIVTGQIIAVVGAAYSARQLQKLNSEEKQEIVALIPKIEVEKNNLLAEIQTSLRDRRQLQTSLTERRTACKRQHELDTVASDRLTNGKLPDLCAALESHLRRKRDLAVILVTHSETLRVLNRFLDLAMQENGLNARWQEAQRLQAACDHFRRFYQNDDHFNNIIEECRRYLFPKSALFP